jgi:hypothetical protein
MSLPPATLTSQVEEAIRGLKGVDGARVRAVGDEIREIHVLTRSLRPAKQIVRDIQTLLLTRFHLEIDHRVVSVVAENVQAEPAPAPRREREAVTGERIRFGSVNVYVTGRRAQAQVEVRWKGVPRMGSASGWASRDGALNLVVQATLATVQEFLDDSVAFGFEGVQVLAFGRREVVVVSLELMAYRANKSLTGSCTVEQDVQQAAVLATLSALNRVIGGLPTREPTEYVVRPTSF